MFQNPSAYLILLSNLKKKDTLTLSNDLTNENQASKSGEGGGTFFLGGGSVVIGLEFFWLFWGFLCLCVVFVQFIYLFGLGFCFFICGIFCLFVFFMSI